MEILGLLGSPHVNGLCSKLLSAVLDGAAEAGAAVKRYDLITCNIMHCMGCCKCLTSEPGLPIGPCPLKDDMHGILEQYVQADGYVLASPVYDVSVTALMKKFLERKIALTYRPADAYARIGSPRRSADFEKKAVLLVTGNCSNEYREVMGDPCFEMMEAHFIVEQVETLEKIYVGSAETIDDEARAGLIASTRETGRRLAAAVAGALETG